MAPPRGRDCNILKPSAVTRTRTGPPASFQLSQWAPIYKPRPEWRTASIHVPKLFGDWNSHTGPNPGICTHSKKSNEGKNRSNKSQLSFHLLDFHSVYHVFLPCSRGRTRADSRHLVEMQDVSKVCGRLARPQHFAPWTSWRWRWHTAGPRPRSLTETVACRPGLWGWRLRWRPGVQSCQL